MNTVKRSWQSMTNLNTKIHGFQTSNALWLFILAVCSYQSRIELEESRRYTRLIFKRCWISLFTAASEWEVALVNDFQKGGLGWFTCPLVCSRCELSHVIFLKLRKKELPSKLSKFTKWQPFHLKRQHWTILSENSCHFVNLLNFASSCFFLSFRKITWVNSQQSKTREHVEYPVVLDISMWGIEK
jgi:hypothetical protein